MAIAQQVQLAAEHIATPYQVTTHALGPSKIATWQDCGLAYKYQYVDRIRKPASPAMMVGSIVHEVIHLAHTNKWEAKHAKDAAQILENLWDEFRGEVSVPDDPQANKSIHEAAMSWLPWYLQFIEKQLDIAVEERWELEYDGIPLTGTIDRVYRHNGKVVISDIKTGKRAPTALVMANDPQLSMYAWAWRELANGANEDAIEIVQIRDLATHPTTRTDEDLLTYMELTVKPVAEAINAGFFPANTRSRYGCSFCAYQNTCPAGHKGL